MPPDVGRLDCGPKPVEVGVGAAAARGLEARVLEADQQRLPRLGRVLAPEALADLGRHVREAVRQREAPGRAHEEPRVAAAHRVGPAARARERLVERAAGRGPAVDAEARVGERRARAGGRGHKGAAAGEAPGVAEPASAAAATARSSSSKLVVARRRRRRAEPPVGRRLFAPTASAASSSSPSKLAVHHLRVERLEPGRPHPELHGLSVRAQLRPSGPRRRAGKRLCGPLVLGHDAVPEGGVVLGDLVLEVGNVERVEQLGAGGGVGGGRRRGPELGRVDDLGAGQDRVDVLLDQLLLPGLARRVVFFKNLLGAEAQDRGHLVLGELLGVVLGGVGPGEDRLCRRRVVRVRSSARGLFGSGRSLAGAAAARGVHALDDEVVEDHLALGALEDVLLLLILLLRRMKERGEREM